MQLSHQNAAVGKEMGRVEVDVEVAHAGAQPLQQLCCNVELPRVGRLLDLGERKGLSWEKLEFLLGCVLLLVFNGRSGIFPLELVLGN